MSKGLNERAARKLVLRRVPEGLTTNEDFSVEEQPVPDAGPGQVVVETHYIGVDAALRLIVRDSDEFLFRVRPGDLVHGSGAGRVLESRHDAFQAGDYVLGSWGVQSHACIDGAQLSAVDVNQASLRSWLGGFGVSGLTAYFALYEECKPQPGQTVLVNGAAGAVGSMAGQFARLAGARTIGVTSSDEKCRWLVETLGYDAAINYRTESLGECLPELAPQGVDVIFDNIGGQVLDDSLPSIAMHGVVLLCGSTSQYSEKVMQGPANYIWLGTMRARLQGFVVFDYEDRYSQARERIARWVDDGKIILPEHIVRGDIEDFPAAFRSLYEGENLGKMLLALPAAGG